MFQLIREVKGQSEVLHLNAGQRCSFWIARAAIVDS